MTGRMIPLGPKPEPETWTPQELLFNYKSVRADLDFMCEQNKKLEADVDNLTRMKDNQGIINAGQEKALKLQNETIEQQVQKIKDIESDFEKAKQHNIELMLENCERNSKIDRLKAQYQNKNVTGSCLLDAVKALVTTVTALNDLADAQEQYLDEIQ